MVPDLEICCFNPESVIIANSLKVDRIEFCKEYNVGGLSPEILDIEALALKCDTPVYAMLRPRKGNFVYSKAEISEMKDWISAVQGKALTGLVTGVLNENNELDVERLESLVKHATDLKMSFHRAFDLVKDPFKAIDILVDLEFERILTSGGRGNAYENVEKLRVMVEYAGDRIEIMPGGGVRPQNLPGLIENTRARAFHSSAIDPTQLNKIENGDPDCDPDIIREMIRIMK